MAYRKFEGNNWLNRAFVLRNERYSIESHHVEGAGGEVALATEGRKAMVYKLRDSSGTHHALKVFHKKHALLQNFWSTLQLLPYRSVEGLKVCDRQVLLEADAWSLSEPALAFAVLMPWMPGTAWAEVVAARQVIPERQCIALARKAAEVLAGLEARGLAHADISSGNVFVLISAAPSVELIDVEEMYHEGFTAPSEMPAGTPGYNYPKSVKTGNWNAYGDRFAGAVLLAEMLTWHHPGIRAERDEYTYFHRDEMCRASLARYDLMASALKSHSRTVADLFRQAWYSDGLQRCPSMNEWREAMAHVTPASTKIGSATSILTGHLSYSPPLANYINFDTTFLSSFVCFECGKTINAGTAPSDHAATCSRHSSNFKFVFDLDPPSEPAKLVLKHPIESIFTRAVGFEPKIQSTTSTCSKCGNLLWGFADADWMHKPNCPERRAETRIVLNDTKPSNTCEECGNLITGSDGSDHRVICSKHPGFTRLQPSQFRNVKFEPLIAPEPAPKAPALTDWFSGLGDTCPECRKFVVPGSAVLKHGPLCSRTGNK